MGLTQALNKELLKAKSILDLCAGTGRLTTGIRGIPKVGVELNPKYETQLKNTGYTEVIIEDVTKFNYDKEYDYITWIDGIEHLKEEDALQVLDKIEAKANTVLVFTPNEFISNQNSVDHLNEPLQAHLSVFPTTFWEARGYEVIYKEYNGAAKVNNLLYKKVFK